MDLCQPQLKTDLARCAKWENFIKLGTVGLLPGEKMEEEREDFRSGLFGLGGDLRGHQNDQYAQCTPEDARHAMKVVHLSIQCIAMRGQAAIQKKSSPRRCRGSSNWKRASR